MVNLSVNLNKVALLRNARDLDIPNICKIAEICIQAGAAGLTIHPRPDERHIRKTDVFELDKVINKRVEFNIEGNPFEGDFMELIEKTRPTQATLVPDSPNAVTSNCGWDIDANEDKLIGIVKAIKDLGIRVSLFMNPDINDIKKVKKIPGTDRVELYTEPYAKAFMNDKGVESFATYAKAAEAAHQLGLGVNAGHDLSLENIKLFTKLPHLQEVSIGHALTAEALEFGFYHTVVKYLEVLI